MAEAQDVKELCSKRKAITTLLPYATWQELKGQPEMLNILLHAARASKMLQFRWYRIELFASALLSKATPHAIVLVSPHIPWRFLRNRGDLAQQWAAATSTVPHTEEVAQSVVDTLLQIAFRKELLPYITADVWLWLTKLPSLPPVCLGRRFGTYAYVIGAVWMLKDVKILKSYLLLTWSEWNAFHSSDEICAWADEDFGGVGMGHHRADLIERLDYILGQLGQGLEYLNQHNPAIDEDGLQTMKQQYGKLKEAFLEANIKAITRVSDPSIVLILY